MTQHVVLLQSQRLLNGRHLLHKHVDTDVSWQRAPVLARQEGVPAPNLKPQRPVSFCTSPCSRTADFTALACAMTLADILGTALSPATDGVHVLCRSRQLGPLSGGAAHRAQLSSKGVIIERRGGACLVIEDHSPVLTRQQLQGLQVSGWQPRTAVHHQQWPLLPAAL